MPWSSRGRTSGRRNCGWGAARAGAAPRRFPLYRGQYGRPALGSSQPMAKRGGPRRGGTAVLPVGGLSRRAIRDEPHEDLPEMPWHRISYGRNDILLRVSYLCERRDTLLGLPSRRERKLNDGPKQAQFPEKGGPHGAGRGLRFSAAG